MNLGAHVVGAKEVGTGFAGRAAVLERQMGALVTHHAQLLKTKIQGNASGRPGPNAPTGDYRRSWSLQIEARGHGMTEAHVGTNKPQGRRLELGFHGVDSLGRNYNQPPFPHVGPAFDVISEAFVRAGEALVRGL